MPDAQAFYADMKERLARYGRSPEHLKIMPGVFPAIGRTEQEAKDNYDQLQELIHPQVWLALLSSMIGADLSGYAIEATLFFAWLLAAGFWLSAS